MKYFFGKLHAPRPDVAQKMTPAEGRLMQEHGAFLRSFAGKGWAMAFGPVADPKGSFGIGLWTLPAAENIQAICDGDPVIKAGLGFRYETHSLPSLAVHGVSTALLPGVGRFAHFVTRCASG